MGHEGVGKRAATAIAVLLLGCLVAPSALLAQDAAPPAPADQTTTAETPPPPPAETPPAAEGTGSESPPADTTTPGSESTTEGATVMVAKGSGVTIADFSFSPASITVNAGGTVSWSNQGPSDHTVTADDGSFDSGALADGQSFSHTFSTAGTFAYHCSIHDEMKGTVVVQGSTGPSNDGGTTGDGSGTDPGITGPTSESAAVDSSGSAGGLPSTGQVELPLALAGVALLLAGAALRRLDRRRA